MAAPKHNLYSIGNHGGRPAHYKNPEDLEAKVIAYFDWCVEIKQDVSMKGLAQFLGFNTRQSILDYEKRSDEFSCIIKRARQAVEMSYELDLRTFKFGGAIFALKNINKEEWKDKTEQEVKQTITNVEASFGTTIQSAHKPGEDTPLDKE